jgi:uncharacterized protein
VTSGPFHAGELAAQMRAFGEAANGGGIRELMSEQHRAFFARLPFIVVAGRDGSGPVATILSGSPGFVSAPNPRTLAIAVPPDPLDPARDVLVPGAPVGVLGIELATRRRNRENGVISGAGPDGFRVTVSQSFGNCPQYIHPRRGYLGPARPLGAPESFEGIDADARAAIVSADTFFVASSDGGDGVDVSHRGGPRGFVRVADDGQTLVIPDYSGNGYFNTLGNFVTDPRAAVLFPDFERGGLLALQGAVEIVWEGPEVEALDGGAERIWRLKVRRGYRRR